MSTRWIIGTAVLLTAMTILALTACARQPMSRASAVADTVPPGPVSASARSPAIAPARQNTGAATTGISAPPRTTAPRTTASTARVSSAPPPPSAFRPIEALRDVHFDFNRYDVRPEEREVLDANISWLRLHPRTLVLLEGHCDTRGTTAYNLSLGDRRAKTILAHLLNHGVAAARINTISYGEEQPLCSDDGETCWARNRRVRFLVKEQ